MANNPDAVIEIDYREEMAKELNGFSREYLKSKIEELKRSPLENEDKERRIHAIRFTGDYLSINWNSKHRITGKVMYFAPPYEKNAFDEVKTAEIYLYFQRKYSDRIKSTIIEFRDLIKSTLEARVSLKVRTNDENYEGIV